MIKPGFTISDFDSNKKKKCLVVKKTCVTYVCLNKPLPHASPPPLGSAQLPEHHARRRQRPRPARRRPGQPDQSPRASRRLQGLATRHWPRRPRRHLRRLGPARGSRGLHRAQGQLAARSEGQGPRDKRQMNFYFYFFIIIIISYFKFTPRR